MHIVETLTSKIRAATMLLVAGLQTILHAHSILIIYILSKFYFPASSGLLEIALKSNATSSYRKPAFLTFCDNIISTTLRGLSPRANYTDRAAAAGRRS
jgi:hypothetical protein